MRKTLLAVAALAALSMAAATTAVQANDYDSRTNNNGYHDSNYRDHHHYRGARYGYGDSWRHPVVRHHYYRRDDRPHHD